MGMNNGTTGKHTVVVHFINPDTEKEKVWVYDFDSQKEAIQPRAQTNNLPKRYLFKIGGVGISWLLIS